MQVSFSSFKAYSLCWVPSKNDICLGSMHVNRQPQPGTEQHLLTPHDSVGQTGSMGFSSDGTHILTVRQLQEVLYLLINSLIFKSTTKAQLQSYLYETEIRKNLAVPWLNLHTKLVLSFKSFFLLFQSGKGREAHRIRKYILLVYWSKDKRNFKFHHLICTDFSEHDCI